MRGIRTLRLTWRGLEPGLRRTYWRTKLETADTAKGSLRRTAPVLDPTIAPVDTNLSLSCSADSLPVSIIERDRSAGGPAVPHRARYIQRRVYRSRLPVANSPIRPTMIK